MAVTDPSGCVAQVVDLTPFKLSQNGYQDRFEVKAEIEESGTGKMKGGGVKVLVHIDEMVKPEGWSLF